MFGSRGTDVIASAGRFSVMRPGAEESWCSCTSFRTKCGQMTGHFTMRNLWTGTFFVGYFQENSEMQILIGSFLLLSLSAHEQKNLCFPSDGRIGSPPEAPRW